MNKSNTKENIILKLHQKINWFYLNKIFAIFVKTIFLQKFSFQFSKKKMFFMWLHIF